MATLVYSPGIQVRIATAREGIIDVSDDIASGSLTITPDEGGSNLSLRLTNHKRKYDGVFTPNDRITVKLKRITWVQTFSGYLTQVPFFSVYGKDVVLTADDTLKRLRYTFWDPGYQDSFNLLQNAVNGINNPGETDSGIRNLMMTLLTEVGKWDAETIHIGQVPRTWFQRVEELRSTLSNQIYIDPALLGGGAVVGGVDGASAAGTYQVRGLGPNSGTGTIPNTSPKAGISRGIDVPKALAPDLADGRVGHPWYASMRFAYVTSNATAPLGYVHNPAIDAAARDRAKRWWSEQRLLVVNPKNQKAIVVRPTHWGPDVRSNADIGLSESALKEALGAQEGEHLQVRFTDPTHALGPVSVTTANTHVVAQGGGAPPSGAAGLDPTDTSLIARAVFKPDGTGLMSHASAARGFIKSNWPGKPTIHGFARRNIAGTNKPSLHGQGRALDVMVSGSWPNDAEVAYGNAVARFFVENPNAFGVTEIIWRGKIITRGKPYWRDYVNGGKTGRALGANQGHYNHVHLSFQAESMSALGPMGSPWATDFEQVFSGGAEGGVASGPLAASGGAAANPLFNINWQPDQDPESNMLAGPRALMNDEPLLNTIKTLCHASMRSYMSAPNGDFISWFPDYFGHYGTASRMQIETIELADEGFSMAWSDSNLITHQFTAGHTNNVAQGGMEPMFESFRKIGTMGIASVDFPEIMEALFNVSRDDPNSAGWINKDQIIQRFGARPDFEAMPRIGGATAEFWYALFLFQRNWSRQFSSSIDLTFMPEIWPGMLAWIKTYGFQAYVEQVTHTWDFSDGGGGFRTSIQVNSPSATDGSGLYGLPRGGYRGSRSTGA